MSLNSDSDSQNLKTTKILTERKTERFLNLNRPKSFQSACVIDTGLSDFHRRTVSVLKVHFRKLPPKVTTYRNF